MVKQSFWVKRSFSLVLVLLLIEFLDELVFGAREAAWPLIRSDLGLSYVQIGILLGLPELMADFVEPFIGILGDTWKRHVLVLGGGVGFALALALTGVSSSFAILLISFILFYPSSGAFVALSQATLMDLDSSRHEHNMARWTLAGSIGVVVGPLALSAIAWLGFGWRGLFLGFALLTVILLVLAWRRPYDNSARSTGPTSFREGIAGMLRALRRVEVLRWLVLLEFSDLMLDVLLGYLALYFVDVVGVSASEAALAVAVWTGAGLVGDTLVIPLLERVRGLNYLLVSTVVEFVLFAAFLLAPGLPDKLILIALVGLFSAGWYSVLKAQLYSTLPGQSGTVMAVDAVFGSVRSVIPFTLGVAAEHFGLGITMWLLLLGPIALFIGIPRGVKLEVPEESE